MNTYRYRAVALCRTTGTTLRDEIVEITGLHGWLEVLVEASYQTAGYRRVKNPRIWSMHDLHVLVGGPR